MYKSPINYIGNKYRLLPQIIPLFPDYIDIYIDLFGGSGTVLLNVDANQYIYNDINPYVADVFRGICSTDTDSLINNMQNIIAEYNLNSCDRTAFEKLRNDYNNGKNDWLTLYTLMCFSFNGQFRFNNKHEYNSSFGKSGFWWRGFGDESQKLIDFNSCDPCGASTDGYSCSEDIEVFRGVPDWARKFMEEMG